ncbi:MAG: RNase adapter RapZ [Alphaproteobacteria bacterium]
MTGRGMTVHGTAVVVAGQAVLLTGPPGSGKSDLALRLMDRGGRLLADDRTELRVDDQGARRGGQPRLVARPSPAIAGRLEIRGVGLVTVPWVAEAPLALVAVLTAPEMVERLPQRETETLLGVHVPRLAIAPFEASAPLKLERALASLDPGCSAALADLLPAATERAMSVQVVSFAFPGGVPGDSHLVFDVRFLADPHGDPALRPLDGRAPRVQAVVRADPAYGSFMAGVTELITRLAPRYEQNGRRCLRLAIGCAGGQHRSVAVAEELAVLLTAAGWPVRVCHRELGVAGGAETGVRLAQPMQGEGT